MKHHPPKVIHRILQTALGGNITLFGLGIVALGFKFRLEILGKKSFKQLEVAFQDIRNDLKYKHRFAVYSQKTR